MKEEEQATKINLMLPMFITKKPALLKNYTALSSRVKKTQNADARLPYSLIGNPTPSLRNFRPKNRVFDQIKLSLLHNMPLSYRLTTAPPL